MTKGEIFITRRSLFVNLALMATVPLSKLAYFLLNRPVETAFVVETRLDQYIPLVPAFVLPYVLWYPFLAVGMFYLAWRDRPGFFRLMTTAHLALVFSYVVYFFFQSTMPRPELVSTDIFSLLLKGIWAADQPYNCLPSIHVLWCILISLAIQESASAPKGHRLLFHLTSLTIILSTLFTKQHGLLDVLAALALGSGIFYAVTYGRLAEVIVAWVRRGYRKIYYRAGEEIS